SAKEQTMKQPRTSSPGVRARLLHSAYVALLFPAFIFVLPQTIQASSATWISDPVSGDWNTAANWTPASVPNGPSDTATFAFSSITAISNSVTTEVNGIVFNAGANAFQITTNSQTALFRISGVGITNNSAITQNFLVDATALTYGTLNFLNSATAGTS